MQNAIGNVQIGLMGGNIPVQINNSPNQDIKQSPCHTIHDRLFKFGATVEFDNVSRLLVPTFGLLS